MGNRYTHLTRGARKGASKERVKQQRREGIEEKGGREGKKKGGEEGDIS